MKDHECKMSRDYCTCMPYDSEPRDDCPKHGCPWPPRCDVCGRFLPFDSVVTVVDLKTGEWTWEQAK